MITLTPRSRLHTQISSELISRLFKISRNWKQDTLGSANLSKFLEHRPLSYSAKPQQTIYCSKKCLKLPKNAILYQIVGFVDNAKRSVT